MYTNKEIIKQARDDNRMTYCGGQYTVDFWSNKHHAWWAGTPKDYFMAKWNLKKAYIESVLTIVYIDEFYQNRFHADTVENYHDWRTYARSIINYARENKQGIFAE